MESGVLDKAGQGGLQDRFGSTDLGHFINKSHREALTSLCVRRESDI